MTDSNRTPDTDSTTTVTSLEQHSPTTDRPKRRRTLFIAGGAVLAAVALAGGGLAVGAALADEDDDDDNDGSRNLSQVSGDDRRDDDNAASVETTDAGSTSAAELSDIIAMASEAADGEPFAIEAERDGSWDVQFRSSAGDETEVRVTADGAATVISTEAAEADDAEPLGVLDTATVDALVSAALAEVDGRITELEIDDDSASPFDVTVISGDGRTTDIALDADLNVLAADRD